jgi:cysteine-rich repeat protein
MRSERKRARVSSKGGEVGRDWRQAGVVAWCEASIGVAAVLIAAGCNGAVAGGEALGGEQVAANKQALTSTDGTTGVGDCDRYLDEYEKCMQSSPKFSQHLIGIRRQRALWATMADTPAKKEALRVICVRARETAREEFGSCTWSTAQCGNGVVEGAEQCDDGNTASGDGCSGACRREAVCGNGAVESGEQCDDANTTNGDGCSAACRTESICGNHLVEGAEQCDDGNVASGDGCSMFCVREASCTDGEKNGTEIDVDCGGSCTAKCADGKMCSGHADCQSGDCLGGRCAAACTEGGATDLGAPGTTKTVANNACLRVRDGYPSWWDTRATQLQTQAGGSYPVPYKWRSACAGTSGEGTFTASWQTQTLGMTNEACATVIKLNGSGSGNVSVTYNGQ